VSSYKHSNEPLGSIKTNIGFSRSTVLYGVRDLLMLCYTGLLLFSHKALDCLLPLLFGCAKFVLLCSLYRQWITTIIFMLPWILQK